MSKLICKSKYPMCPKDAQPGGIHQLRISQLSPTQFAVGKAEVSIKSKRMLQKHKHHPKKLHDYLVVRPVPVVTRNGKFYLQSSPDSVHGRLALNRGRATVTNHD